MKSKQKTKNTKIDVVILAAGKGVRAGGKFKQFQEINGKPLMLFSVEEFLTNPLIGTIVIAVPKNKIKLTSQLMERFKVSSGKRIHIIEGGVNRRESALLSLKYLLFELGSDSEYVFFHDAARPMISKELIKKLYRDAVSFGASTVGIPAIDLLFVVEKKLTKGDVFIEKAINKVNFYYGFTPQCLPLKLLWRAHCFAVKDKKIHDIDNIELLKLYSPSIKIKIIDDFYPNIKFTYPEDLKILKALLHNGEK